MGVRTGCLATLREENYYANRIRELYVDYKKSRYEVMDELELSEFEFDSIRFRYGIEKIKCKHAQKIKESEYKKIYEMNTIQKITMKKIAKKYGVTTKTISRIIDKWRIRNERNITNDIR
jgi:DNA-binding MarR family transcriptional regulator